MKEPTPLNRLIRVFLALAVPVAIAVPALIRTHDLSPANVVVAQFTILIAGLGLGEVVFIPATRGSLARRIVYVAVYTIVLIAILAYAALWVEGAVFGNTL